jgi:hypothetical protein
MLARWLWFPLVAVCASALSGAIIVSQGPTSLAGDANVLFNQAGLTTTGPIVEGNTQAGLRMQFRDAGEDLTTPANGQARVEGVDGSYTALTIRPALANVSFLTLVLNINASTMGTVQFTVTPVTGPALVQSFDVNGNGQNFFGIEATAGDRIRSVSFVLSNNANTPSGDNIFAQDTRQVRVGGIGRDDAVPEPSTYVLASLGALGVWLGRRRAAANKL